MPMSWNINTMQNDYKGENVMAQKISKKSALSIQGTVAVDDEGKIFVSIEDKGEYFLSDLMKSFDGNECKISVSYDEEYVGPEVDTETGEILE